MTHTRDKLLIGAGLGAAVFAGFSLANGDFVVPMALLFAGVAAVFSRFSPLPALPALLLGLVSGYFVANRGFAQLSVAGNLPLFPAEVVLALGGTLWIWQRARAGGMDFALRGAPALVGLWLLYGTARLFPEVKLYGITALRDYATVYYAGFFFLALSAARQVDFSSHLLQVIRIGCLLLVPLFWLFTWFPDAFIDGLTIRGNPVFYYKADLAGTFLALGTLCWFLHARNLRYPIIGYIMSVACAATVFSTHNRASMLGLAVGIALLVLRGRTRILKGAAVAGAVGILGLTVWVESGQRSWQDTPVPGLIEAMVSVTDVRGEGRYNAEEVENKGDNNRFRAVWWRTVVQEAWARNPLLGAGYGYDLTTPFLKVYYPDSNEDFTARSPHSIWLTVFGRLGFIGLVLFLGVVAALALRTWQLLGRPDYAVTALPGLCALMILASAGFGVVLEGPMGAVVFWICFGCMRERGEVGGTGKVGG